MSKSLKRCPAKNSGRGWKATPTRRYAYWGALLTLTGALAACKVPSSALEILPEENTAGTTPAATAPSAPDAAPRRDTRVLSAPPVENLGVMASQAVVRKGPVGRDANGDIVQIFFVFPNVKTKRSRQSFEIVQVNLKTGEVARTPGMTRPDDFPREVWSTTWARDGALYLGTNSPPYLLRYDPRTRSVKEIARVWRDNPRAVMIYSLTTGTDGAIYGGGANDTNVFRYDPNSGKLDEYGPQGVPRESYPAYAYSIGADERYIYTASGKQPWYIVALDRQSGTQRNLLTFHKDAFPTIDQYTDRVIVRVSHQGKNTAYDLKNGEATLLQELGPRTENYDPVPRRQRPPIDLDLSTQAGAGKAVLRFSDRGTVKTTEFAAPTSEFSIQTLMTTPDGRIFGATMPYGNQFFYNPKTSTIEIAGPTNVSVYAMLPIGDQIYISGYPNVPLLRYDPKRPWTYRKPKANTLDIYDDDDKDVNPRRVAYFNQANINAHYGYHLAQGTDGKIYVGAHAERVRNGGGLGIYDPSTGKATGIGEEEFANDDVAGLISVGRFIVYSSRLVKNVSRPTMPESARLFVYDTTAQRIVNRLAPVPRAQSTGPIATDGNAVVGIAFGDGKRQTVYRMNLENGAVEYSRPVERSLTGPLKKGPDGFLWTYEKAEQGSYLVKIAPTSGEIVAVAKLDFTPGDFTFSGRDIYFGNSGNLYRIRNVAK